VQRALAGLPADQKEVVSLAYLEGLSHSEIAERLGVPLGTVKSRMRIAYQKIRQALENLE
jgi:RNA polymerase sigma-70 factor (ECF subfamily)